MDRVDNEKYVSFLNRLIRVTHEEYYDRESYVELIVEICKTYRLSKGVSEFYITPMMEQRGIGEVFCDFDNGKGEKVLLKLRFLSSTKAVVIGTLYGEADEGERDQEEITQLDTMLRIILGFISRRRLIRMLEEFGFFDIDGYHNFRAFARFADMANIENRLGYMDAFHIDMHNFTIVNQEIGRENGNKVLRNYYKMLEDTIGSNGIVSRLGGDKFIGIFDRKIEKNIVSIFSGIPIIYDETNQKRINVSAAAGIYTIPNPFMMKTYSDIMDKIMIAGNIAKHQEGGSIVFYDDKMKSEMDHVRKIQTDFLAAIENEEFAVYYQPKVDIEKGVISGAEALCRWIKDGTVIPPMSFIPVLETNTFICDLDFYMLDHVCRHIRKWLDEGREVVRVSVNLSRKHLVDADLQEHIFSIIDRYQVPHEYIELELTETTTEVMFWDLRRIVNGLQEQGVWTAVDDFGVGYSSLNLIREIPWNVLKVDKSLVPSDDQNLENKSNKMFEHVISLAHDIGLECVIEGVETKEQLEILKKNKCKFVQGFYFDRPLPVLEFEKRLDKRVYDV